MNRLIKENKKFRVLLLSLFCLSVFVVMANPVFPQGRSEFTRLRSTSYGGALTTPATNTFIPVPEYYMSPGDKIRIYVWQNPDLSLDVTIREDGKLSYPLVGTFKAAGLSIDQLQDEFKTRFIKYIRSPEITVTVTEAVGNKVMVLGEVAYPGVYTFHGTIDVVSAIAMAGDFTREGRREGIMIISDNFTANPKMRRFNALDAIRKGMATSAGLLKPNDVVYVPRSTIADWNKLMGELAPTIQILSNTFTMGSNLSNVAVDGRAWFMHRTLKVADGNSGK